MEEFGGQLSGTPPADTAGVTGVLDRTSIDVEPVS